MPGIPADVHFFVFERGALGVHVGAARRDGDRRRALSDAHRRAAADRGDAARRGDRMNTTDGHRSTRRRVSRVFRDAGRTGARPCATSRCRFAAGDHIAIRGPSGCGKSTLLHMLGCVDTPSSGTLLFDGHDVATLSDAAAQPAPAAPDRLRLPALLPAADADRLRRTSSCRSRKPASPKRERQQRTQELLDYVGLARARRSSAVAALGRRDAARRHRARAGQPPAAAAGRRADRRARSTPPASRSPRCSIASTPTARRSSSSRTTRRWPNARAAS